MRNALLVCLAVLAIALPAAGQGMPPAQVFVDPARMEVVDSYRETTGSLRPERRAVVASREEGVVEFLDVDEGDVVRAGDVLARLDSDLLELDVRRARAQVESDRGIISEREAELENAQRDLTRLESLDQRGSARPVELDDARTETARLAAQLQQAQADLAVHEAELARVEHRLADATITAPFDGRVVSTSTELGEWIDSGGDVAELIAIDTLECWLDVPETAISVVRESSEPMRVRIDALDRTIEAPISAVVPDADPLSRLFPVRLTIDNAAGELAPGMSVTGLAPTGLRGEALTIHRDSLRVDALGEYVFLDRAGVADVVRVHTLYASGERVVIRPGDIRPGDRLVVEGNERIIPGQPLIILGETVPADTTRSAR